MERVTKAAIATGAAAILLLGGAGTLAYWNQGGQSTIGGLTTGNLSADNQVCTDWTYANGSAEGTAVVNGLVPGDEVTVTCTIDVTGKGDHLGIVASFTGFSADSVNSQNITGLSATVGSPELVTGKEGGATIKTDSSNNSYVDMSTSTGPATISVEIDVTYAYADGDNTGQNITVAAADQALSLTVSQINTSTDDQPATS
jgi:alternate signal-mediated exported protein